MFRRSGMRRFRRKSSGITQSTKLQREEKVSYIGGNANNVYIVATGKELPDVTVNGTDVPVGAKIFSTEVSVNYITSGGGTTGSFEWFLWKARAGQDTTECFADPAGANWTTIGLSGCRNQIIKSYMGVYGTEDSSAVRYNVHPKIPKSMQRTRLGDQLLVVFNADQAGTLSIGTRYKYYT